MASTRERKWHEEEEARRQKILGCTIRVHAGSSLECGCSRQQTEVQYAERCKQEELLRQQDADAKQAASLVPTVRDQQIEQALAEEALRVQESMMEAQQ